MNNVDALIARNTGFRDMADMLDAGGRYRPSLDMRQAWAREVADAYDAAQEARGDDRRAYRYAVEEGAKIVAQEAAAARLEAERAERAARLAAKEARGMEVGDVGSLFINQGKRTTYCVAIDQDSGRALVEYEMPSGRCYLLDVPAAYTLRKLREMDSSEYCANVRNVSATRPPKRWSAVVAGLVAERAA